MMKNISLLKIWVSLLLAGILAQSVNGQAPDGYYKSIENKAGAELKTALFEVIKNPKAVPYAQLWKAFETTDVTPTGKVWDMYSAKPNGKSQYEFDFQSGRCGRYKKEGDCYNREHSVPKSWFKEAPPMHSDLFHIYPTDGFVNNKRANLPFGEVGIARWESSNGSKVGQNTFGGYSKTVFEPIDEYKGDFARSYFYMVTAYEDRISDWVSDQIGGSAYPGFSEWSLALMLKWHRNDPVSLKETRRNEEVYKIQGNRNPYLDYPELAEHVWGNYKTKPFAFHSATDAPVQKESGHFERWVKKITNLFNIKK